MTAETGKRDQRFILVVDNDMNVLKKVESALRRKEYEVQLATDGALAINRALADPPNIVISAVEMPLLDGFKLCQLLRTNPVTKDIPFLFLTSKETSPQRLGKYLRPFDEFLLKPFKEEDLTGRIEGLLVRMEKVEEVTTGGQQSLIGTLSEITLMDLLQILRMNRRSGFLNLDQMSRLATIFIRDGEVINAKLGKFKGEKAFYRLLDWNKGKFEFRPQSVETEVLIDRPGENLILEGLRQLDETNMIRENLSGKEKRLKMAKKFHGPPEKLRPVTRETMKLLDYFSNLDDILDQSTFNDLEICQTIQILIDKKIVTVTAGSEEGQVTDGKPLISLEEALKLSYQLGVGREETPQDRTGKLLLFVDDRSLLQNLLEGLSRHKEFKIDAGVVLDPRAKTVPLGIVGSIQILEGTDLSLYSFSSEPGYQPLWSPLSQGALGNLIISGEGGSIDSAARFCDTVLKRPFVVCGPDLPDDSNGSALDLGWKPSVPCGSLPLQIGKAGSYREIFRRLFALILEQ